MSDTVAKNMSFTDRYLTIWIGADVAAGMALDFCRSEARRGEFLDRWTDGQMFGKVPFVCACVRVRVRARMVTFLYLSVQSAVRYVKNTI